MRKTILIIFIIILVGFAGSFGYFLWQKQSIQEKIPKAPISEEPKTIPVQRINLSGKVKEITDNSLIVATESEILEVLIDKETTFLANVPVQEEQKEETIGPKPVGKKIEFKDIKAGEEVKVFCKKENDNLIGISILVEE